jgi:hypothetical protein
MRTATFARSVVGALWLLVAFASSSNAQLALYHGSLCNPEQESVNRVEYSQFGVHNIASPIAFVTCGGAIEDDKIIQSVTVIVYDRNSIPGADVFCTLTLVDRSGNTLFSAAQSSTGAQGAAQELVFALAPVTSATIHLRCSIPPPDTLGVSYVTTYGVRTPL